MGTFDPVLAPLNPSIFPDKKVGDTIWFFSRIVKEVDGKQYTCGVWSSENCGRCKEIKCPFFRGKES